MGTYHGLSLESVKVMFSSNSYFCQGVTVKIATRCSTVHSQIKSNGTLSGTSTEWLLVHWNPDRIGIWKCWFLRRRENLSTWRKTSRAEKRTNNKLNPHMASSPRIHPKPHWWEASALTTTPSLLPKQSIRHSLTLFWFKMNATLKVTIQNQRFWHSCLVSSSIFLVRSPVDQNHHLVT